jgi:hypothetical protein
MPDSPSRRPRNPAPTPAESPNGAPRDAAAGDPGAAQSRRQLDCSEAPERAPARRRPERGGPAADRDQSG